MTKNIKLKMCCDCLMSKVSESQEQFSMDPFHMLIFFDEALFKIGLARQARDKVVTSFHLGERELIWYHLESLAGSVTSVANIFWPTRSGFPKKRGRYLRDALGLSTKMDNTVRDVRNGYIHFDERIDDKLVIPDITTYIDKNQAPLDSFRFDRQNYIARNFDILKWELSIFGASTKIDELLQYMERVEKLCLNWKESHDPFWNEVSGE